MKAIIVTYAYSSLGVTLAAVPPPPHTHKNTPRVQVNVGSEISC